MLAADGMTARALCNQDIVLFGGEHFRPISLHWAVNGQYNNRRQSVCQSVGRSPHSIEPIPLSWQLRTLD